MNASPDNREKLRVMELFNNSQLVKAGIIIQCNYYRCHLLNRIDRTWKKYLESGCHTTTSWPAGYKRKCNTYGTECWVLGRSCIWDHQTGESHNTNVSLFPPGDEGPIYRRIKGLFWSFEYNIARNWRRTSYRQRLCKGDGWNWRPARQIGFYMPNTPKHQPLHFLVKTSITKAIDICGIGPSQLTVQLL